MVDHGVFVESLVASAIKDMDVVGDTEEYESRRIRIEIDTVGTAHIYIDGVDAVSMEADDFMEMLFSFIEKAIETGAYRGKVAEEIYRKYAGNFKR